MSNTVEIHVKRRAAPDAPQYWEEFEIPYRRNLNVISCLMEIRKNPITKSGQTIASNANSQEAKDFLVKIKLTPTDEIRTKLRPGMSATATITTAMVDSVLTVPLQAIVPRELPKEKAAEQPPATGGPAKKKEVEGVFIYDNGKARFVEVTTGIKGDQEIELKSGPKESERIIIGPYKTLRNLKDGDMVKEEAKPAGPETKS